MVSWKLLFITYWIFIQINTFLQWLRRPLERSSRPSRGHGPLIEKRWLKGSYLSLKTTWTSCMNTEMYIKQWIVTVIALHRSFDSNLDQGLSFFSKYELIRTAETVQTLQSLYGNYYNYKLWMAYAISVFIQISSNLGRALRIRPTI